jgi:hypothetical protein
MLGVPRQPLLSCRPELLVRGRCKRGQTRTRRPVRFPRPSRGWVRPLAPLIPAHESPVNTQQVLQAKRTARALGRAPA